MLRASFRLVCCITATRQTHVLTRRDCQRKPTNLQASCCQLCCYEHNISCTAACIHTALQTQQGPAVTLPHACTALAGQKFFKELDSNGDGYVDQGDVARALRRRNLPEHYAKEFIATARGSRWWSSSITCAPAEASFSELCVCVSLCGHVHWNVRPHVCE